VHKLEGLRGRRGIWAWGQLSSWRQGGVLGTGGGKEKKSRGGQWDDGGGRRGEGNEKSGGGMSGRTIACNRKTRGQELNGLKRVSRSEA